MQQATCPAGAALGTRPAEVYRRRPPERTVLHRLVREHLETYLARAEEADPLGDGVPLFVEAQFRAYLRCGILAHGFARARCTGCGHDSLIAFSCKGRGLCPSCNTRHMAATAAHLTDHVIPWVPVRQWVPRCRSDSATSLTGSRRRPAPSSTSCSAPSGGRLASEARGPAPRPNSAPSPSSTASASLNAHFHYHLVVLDGVFEEVEEVGAAGAAGSAAPGQGVRFHEATALTRADVEALQGTVRRRVLRWFHRHGLLEEHTVHDMLAWEHAGGFSLDASIRIAAHDRAGFERLLRYCARPPFALERLVWSDRQATSEVTYRLHGPTPDGRTALRLSPLEEDGTHP